MAKLQKSESLKCAEKVLKLIDVPKSIVNETYVRPFRNGREHGYHLSYSGNVGFRYLNISFAQNRNSDDIVIYSGESNNGDWHDGQPSERAYDTRMWFSYNEHAKAAAHIEHLLKSFK